MFAGDDFERVLRKIEALEKCDLGTSFGPHATSIDRVRPVLRQVIVPPTCGFGKDATPAEVSFEEDSQYIEIILH